MKHHALANFYLGGIGISTVITNTFGGSLYLNNFPSHDKINVLCMAHIGANSLQATKEYAGLCILKLSSRICICCRLTEMVHAEPECVPFKTLFGTISTEM